MTSASNVQTSFAGGEWGKSAQGRMDNPLYRKAMNLCQNVLPLTEGAAPRRFGFRQSAPTRAGLVGKLLPFIQSSDAAYNIELTDEHMRFFQNGSLLVETWMAVTNIALSTYVTITAAGHGFATDDVVQFTFSTDAAALKFAALTRRQFVVRYVDADTFTIGDGLTSVGLTDSFTAFDSTTDTVSVGRVVDLETPYAAGSWADTRILQSDDRTLLLNGAYAPQEISISSVDPALFIDGPYLDPVPGSYMTPDALTGVVNLVLSFQAYVATTAYSVGDYVTSSSVGYRSLVDLNVGHTPASSPTYWEVALPSAVVNDGAGFGADDEGRHVRLLSEPPFWATATTYAAGDVVTFNGSYWAALTSMTGATPTAGTVNPNQPGLDATKWAPNASAARWTWGKVVAFASIPGLLDPTTGTNIGDMTQAGGLAALFDSDVTQTFSQNHWPQQAASSSGFPGYAGKHWAAAVAVGSAKIYPSSDYGYGSAGVPNQEQNFASFGGTVTVNLRAKHTAPASATDGTLLGTTGAFANDAVARTITSNDTATLWEYVWLEVRAGTGAQAVAAEIQFYSSTSPAGSGVAVQLIGDPLLYTTAIRTWRLGLFNNTEPKWPTCGCYHEGRFWLGGAKANRIDGSVSNKELTFSPTAPDGTVADNNAISYTTNSATKNALLWLRPDPQGVLAGTAGAAVLYHATNNNNLMTPTSIQAHPVTSYGCAAVEPVNTGLSTVFVHQHRRQVQEQMRDAYSGQIVSPELTEAAKHLTRGGVTDLAYTRALQPVVWALTGEGALIGVTYQRTNLVSQNPPDINAWHQHPLGSGRDVVSISTAPSFTDDLDTLGIITLGGDGTYYVEFGTHLPEEDDTIYDAEFLDSAIVPSCAEAYTSDTGIRFHGLWAHNNQTVAVWAAGLDLGDFPVTAGYVEVPFGSDAGGLFTRRYLTELDAQQNDYGELAVSVNAGDLVIPAVIGYPFVSRGQTLRPVAPDASGAQNGPAFGKTKRAQNIGLMLHNAQGLYLGTGFDKMRPAIFKTPGQRKYTPIELFSGIFVDTVEDDNTLDAMLAWEVRRPYPATVLAIGGFLTTQDK